MTGLERLTVPIEQGTLSVVTAGAPTDQPIMLLHGIPSNAYLFRDVLPRLAQAGYYALAPDMPGYGETRLGDDADYSLSAVADTYAAWLERDAYAPVWLVGHDLGGAVAQLIAVRYPHLLSRLTLGNCPLGDSFPVPAVNMAVAMARAGLFLPFASLGLFPNFYMTGEVRRGFGDSARLTSDMLDTVFWAGKTKSEAGRREFAKHLRHLRNDESVEIVPQLKSLPMPVQVLWSSLDRHQSAETSGRQLLLALPEGTPFEVVEGAGHFMPLETPADYATRLLAWPTNQ
ncbi:MAG: alpha/beta hydrolase [Chloroflexi bacterium]|nr:alpha/beta hydrolase [Chloroflexota bacterium]